MNENKLNLTFEGPLISSHGVPLEDLIRTVSHVQRAIRLLVREIEGIDATLGRPPQIVVEQSTLRLVKTSPGSVTTEWELTPPVGIQSRLDGSGVRAVQILFRHNNGSADNSPGLSPTVIAELDQIGIGLSDDVDVVKMTSPINTRSVEFRRQQTEKVSSTPEADLNHEVRIGGRLLEVNWNRGTAQLHRYADRYIRLRFSPELSDEMRRLATQYVDICGRGVVDETDDWRIIDVESISKTNSWMEPFDVEAVLNSPNKKVFRRENIVTASVPFDAEEFNRIVREGRSDT